MAAARHICGSCYWSPITTPTTLPNLLQCCGRSASGNHRKGSQFSYRQTSSIRRLHRLRRQEDQRTEWTRAVHPRTLSLVTPLSPLLFLICVQSTDSNVFEWIATSETLSVVCGRPVDGGNFRTQQTQIDRHLPAVVCPMIDSILNHVVAWRFGNNLAARQ